MDLEVSFTDYIYLSLYTLCMCCAACVTWPPSHRWVYIHPVALCGTVFMWHIHRNMTVGFIKFWAGIRAVNYSICALPVFRGPGTCIHAVVTTPCCRDDPLLSWRPLAVVCVLLTKCGWTHVRSHLILHGELSWHHHLPVCTMLAAVPTPGVCMWRIHIRKITVFRGLDAEGELQKVRATVSYFFTFLLLVFCGRRAIAESASSASSASSWCFVLSFTKYGHELLICRIAPAVPSHVAVTCISVWHIRKGVNLVLLNLFLEYEEMLEVPKNIVLFVTVLHNTSFCLQWRSVTFFCDPHSDVLTFQTCWRHGEVSLSQKYWRLPQHLFKVLNMLSIAALT